MITTKELLHTYKNGNCSIDLYSDGTKIRTCAEKIPAPVFPESIDLKITDYCSEGCKFCHESCTKKGKHSDIRIIKYLLNCNLPAGTEIAVGGGDPTSHPHLEPLLEWMKCNDLIANLTVTNGVATWKSRLIKTLQEYKLIYGLGVSYKNLKDIHMDDQLTKLPYNDNTVLHTIVGVTPPQDLLTHGKGKKILVLGFKNYGRGKKMYAAAEKKFGEWRYWISTIMKMVKVISFDNLAIEQLNIKDRITPSAWKSFYMGDEGQFTMYIDAVNNKYAVSSTSERHDIGRLTIKEMFKNVRGLCTSTKPNKTQK